MNIFFFIVVASILFHKGGSDVFSSVEDLKDVLKIETALAGTLQSYIAAEKRRTELLERFVENQQRQQQSAVGNVESYVGNPINAFLLIKRLTTEWKNLESLIFADTAQEFLQNASQLLYHPKFPTSEDLSGAAAGLLRIQFTYRLDEDLLVKGVIANTQHNSTLSGSDCYELGKEAYDNAMYSQALRWLQHAEIQLKKEPDVLINKKDLLENLLLAAYQYGDTQLALNYTKDLMEAFPEHKAASVYFDLFTKMVEDKKERPLHELVISRQQAQSNMLCRKEVEMSVEVTSKLKCSYVNNDHPGLFIAPFKMEELYLNPNIVVFHDVVSDKEIGIIKNLSFLLMMQRSGVFNGVKSGVSTYRVSKVAWLMASHSEHIDRINRRLADMTGLNTTTTSAEPLQVVSYGIGGHYDYHTDYFGDDIKEAFGQRIATVLIYLSDVEEGGATVFPHLNVTVWPRKGSAVLWYNLDSYGNQVPNTAHCACPVLVGSKWAANKWIKQNGQEFTKPCPLHRGVDQVVSSSKI